MTEYKSFFRNVFEAMIESRTQQAAREVAFYRKSFGLKDKSNSL